MKEESVPKLKLNLQTLPTSKAYAMMCKQVEAQKDFLDQYMNKLKEDNKEV